MCRIQFRFQNLPFSESAGKEFAVFLGTGGLSVTYSLFLKCAGIVRTQSSLKYRINGGGGNNRGGGVGNGSR